MYFLYKVHEWVYLCAVERERERECNIFLFDFLKYKLADKFFIFVHFFLIFFCIRIQNLLYEIYNIKNLLISTKKAFFKTKSSLQVTWLLYPSKDVVNIIIPKLQTKNFLKLFSLSWECKSWLLLKCPTVKGWDIFMWSNRRIIDE